MKIAIPLFSALFALLCFNSMAESTMKSVTVSASTAPLAPIMIQGPMPIEAEYFASLLTDVRVEHSGNATFYLGELNGYPMVVAKTGKGLENTAAATAIGIARYQPRMIINQGTSGGHDPALHVGDIVLGEKSVNASNFKTPKLSAGEGSNPLDWIPMDIMASEGSAGEGDSAADAEKIRFYAGDETLLTLAMSLSKEHKSGNVVKGTIGSGNFWNNEIDRIAWLHKNLGTSVEEMESAAAAQMAHAYGVPFLGIRILSNNITNNGEYNPNTAEACQVFVKAVVEAYISSLKTASATVNKTSSGAE
ncbi:5'-methylthioadenosine/S-adenosylhomocysteine nucleosidase [Alteromonas sp. 1_MG-2023]|uniref:5'-methylthioadenosine/S-adenosylhomocysteine nucleosidase n=1 Tax=Alteromonas sp. 1_MG-2023 TaxID=3062669 RepID=UPI0026E3B171|nr:5'-methylthioadenosine/S-adenosylhomocysteine nucleosidase [Alteromonas sp. 1_MG-2023]MDO6567635.1 5'-methylthioadenosine/S-adenosylhomocysteine nucleosidase [Alteromonas sp. 1_MG-2023]